MANYVIPATQQERLDSFVVMCNEFSAEYSEFKAKNKKISAYKARKALLNISKLTKSIRKDIQDSLDALKKN